jgi:2-polyprenyl-3-methyl-5-hydroxy-6-metoxy-1,4-benzoquinol methylase
MVENLSKADRVRELAASIASRSRFKNPNSDYDRIKGELMAKDLTTDIEKAFGSNPEIAVLDFGAAAGRVSVPLAKMLPRSRVTATDVDAEAVEYLQLTALDNLKSQLNGFSPPLALAPGSLDCVIAISVWSHFADRLAMEWLEEMKRITRPGALLLISTQGDACLQYLQKAKPLWAKVTKEQYLKDKYIYRDYPIAASQHLKLPGITAKSNWGITVVHPDYIREKWGALFEILEIREQKTVGKQDMVIMRRP